MPLATSGVAVATAAYRGGKASLAEVLAARGAELESAPAGTAAGSGNRAPVGATVFPFPARRGGDIVGPPEHGIQMKTPHIVMVLAAAGVMGAGGYGLYRLGVKQETGNAAASPASQAPGRTVLYWQDPMVRG